MHKTSKARKMLDIINLLVLWQMTLPAILLIFNFFSSLHWRLLTSFRYLQPPLQNKIKGPNSPRVTSCQPKTESNFCYYYCFSATKKKKNFQQDMVIKMTFELLKFFFKFFLINVEVTRKWQWSNKESSHRSSPPKSQKGHYAVAQK